MAVDRRASSGLAAQRVTPAVPLGLELFVLDHSSHWVVLVEVRSRATEVPRVMGFLARATAQVVAAVFVATAVLVAPGSS